MYIIIGSHCVPLEGKLLLIALGIVRITLSASNVLKCPPSNVCPSFRNVLPNSQTLRQCYFHLCENKYNHNQNKTNKQTKQIFICRTLCFNIKLDTSSTMVCTNTVKHDNIVKNLEAPRSYKDDIHLYIGIQGRIQDFKLGGRT